MEIYSEMRYNDTTNIVANAKRCDFMIPKTEEALKMFQSLSVDEKRKTIEHMKGIKK